MDTVADRLRWARKRAEFKTPTEAARENGWVVSTYLGHENGDRVPKRPTAKRYARAFKVRWEWLLEAEGQPTLKPLLAPVVGYVRAGGAEIIPVDDFAQGAALDEVEMPFARPDIVAVIVDGESMKPRYLHGERVFYVKDERPPSDFIGQECIVKLRDGRMMLKILRKGYRAGRFNLHSWNAEPIEDEDVEWAAPVKWRG